MLQSARFRLWMLVILTVVAVFLFWGLPLVTPQRPMVIEFGQGQDSE